MRQSFADLQDYGCPDADERREDASHNKPAGHEISLVSQQVEYSINEVFHSSSLPVLGSTGIARSS